jgi:ribose 1,5-bisphosphokinase
MDHAAAAEQAASGRLVVVVGPSGAGKDTLMAFAAERMRDRADVVFVRRVITRDGNAGGEDHDAVSEEEFLRRAHSGRFAVSWQAHGLSYGIPAETLQQIAEGRVVVANGSRSALPHFKSAFPSMTVVNVTARPEVLAARLEARGRESREEILRRLQRSTPTRLDDYDVVTIDNSGSIEDAGEAMVDALAHCLPVSRPR